MSNEKGNTTNTVLIILLVIIVGFVVWYATARNTDTKDSGAGIEVNLGSDGANQNGGGY